MRLSDSIESFIKELIRQEDEGVELRRNELAEYFRCAPSQINYVLATRFTLDDGYMIESRRGGGGYIRIVQVRESGEESLSRLLRERIGDEISEQEAVRLIGQLTQRGAVSESQSGMLRAAISTQALALPIPDGMKNALRARILKVMITEAARQQNNAQQTEG